MTDVSDPTTPDPTTPDPTTPGEPRGGGLDLTPRTSAATGRRRRRTLPMVVIAVVVLGIGGLQVKTLGDASLFFKNADAAVAERAELGDSRFRMQGTVLPDTVLRTELDGQSAVQFSVAYNGVEVDVIHVGDPPQLFKPDVPVVLEGRWTQGSSAEASRFLNGANDGWYFASDRMLVKHDSTYTAKNSERLDEADEGGKVPVAVGPNPTTAPTPNTGAAR